MTEPIITVEPEPIAVKKANCSCSNEGKPYLLQGMMVTSRDPACRVHNTTLSVMTQPLSAERLLGGFRGRERTK